MLAPSLNLRQSTSLVMTPQLRQAIALLQSTNLEAAAFLAEQAEANPLLELTYDDLAATGDSGPTEFHAATVDMALSDGAAPDAATFSQSDIDDAPYDVRAADPGGADVELDDRPEAGAPGPSLRARLAEQIALTFSDVRPRLIASHLLALLDEAGRLPHTPDEMAESLGITRDELEAVRTTLMQLEPCGVFATTLEECLEAQLRAVNRFDPAMAALLVNLDLLAARDIPALRRVCNVDAEDMAEMIAELRALDPKPGFEPDSAPIAIVPDVWVKAHGGSFRVALNSATLPRVRLNEELRSSLARDRTARSYLTERAASAAWVVKSIESRTNSLLAVSRAIVVRQEGFLRDGVTALRPMTLREIAEDTALHESTVSRVTANKYAATPRGTIALRFFFSVSLGAGADGHSAEAIRHRIRTMIEREPPDGILSDDAISDILRKDGIEIMRRTVAKYREAMGLPTSAQRKREKRTR